MSIKQIVIYLSVIFVIVTGLVSAGFARTVKPCKEQQACVHSTTPWNWCRTVQQYGIPEMRPPCPVTFPASELQCPGDAARVHLAGAGVLQEYFQRTWQSESAGVQRSWQNIPYPRLERGTEFLFTHVSKHIQNEATRQLNRVFSSNDQRRVPVDLIAAYDGVTRNKKSVVSIVSIQAVKISYSKESGPLIQPIYFGDRGPSSPDWISIAARSDGRSTWIRF
jgi:hypothetical protein